MTTRLVGCTALLVVALILSGMPAQGATITPVSGTASSNEEALVGPDRAINGSGLTLSSPLESSTHSNGDPGGGGSLMFWISAEVAPTVDFDLGNIYDVDSLVLWNFNVHVGSTDETNRGVNGFNLIASVNSTFGDGDDVNFNGLTATEGGGTNSEAGQVFNMTGANGVQHVRIDVQTNYGGPKTGLSEVRFTGTLVPEPASALMASLAGMIGVAVFRRRRRS